MVIHIHTTHCIHTHDKTTTQPELHVDTQDTPISLLSSLFSLFHSNRSINCISFLYAFSRDWFSGHLSRECLAQLLELVTVFASGGLGDQAKVNLEDIADVPRLVNRLLDFVYQSSLIKSNLDEKSGKNSFVVCCPPTCFF